MLREITTLDRTKSHIVRFDNSFYADKMDLFNKYVEEAKKIWNMVVVEQGKIFLIRYRNAK